MKIRHKSYTEATNNVLELKFQPVEQTPVKYYLAEQFLKAAARRDQYVKQELTMMLEQKELLERIKHVVQKKEGMLEELEDSCVFQPTFNEKDQSFITRKRFAISDKLNNTTCTHRFHHNHEQQILVRVQRYLGKEEYDFISNLIKQNNYLKKQLDDEERFKVLFQSQKKTNQVVRVQNLKYQTKIAQLDKQLTKANDILKSLKLQKQNYCKSIHKIQSQVQINNKISTQIKLHQRILKNEHIRFQCQKQFIEKAKAELEKQEKNIYDLWSQYLPEELVQYGKQDIRKYTRLLETEYQRIRNLEMECSNSISL